MSITQILVNIFFILSIILVARYPKEKRIWWIFFICNICIQIYFRTDSFFKSKEIYELNKQVEKLSLYSPKLNLEGKIVLDSGLTGSSEASETIETIRKLSEGRKYIDAYNIAKSLVKKMPNFGMGYFALGTIEAIIGNNDSSAETNLYKAINLGLLKYFEAWACNNLAIIKERQDKIDEAILLLEKGVALDHSVQEIKNYLDHLRLKKSQK